MSYYFNPKSSGDTPDLEKAALNVPFNLFLAVLVVCFVLAVYVKGNVQATLLVASQAKSQNQSGFKQYFRGFLPFIIHRLVKVLFLSMFPVVGTEIMNCFLLNIIVELHLSTLKMSNIHAILGQPFWDQYRRIFDLPVWLKLFPASLLHNTALSLCFYLPVHINRLYGITDGKPNPYGTNEIAQVFAIMVVLYFGVTVPCYCIFIRVAAFLLPLEDGSSVGSEVDADLSIWKAWKTLSWSDYIAFVKTLALVLVFEVVISISIFSFVVGLFHPALHNDVAAFFVKYAG